VQLCTPCAVLVLISAHYCSYNLQQCDATPHRPPEELTALPQTPWPDYREMKGMEKGWEREREEFCAVVIFLGKKR